MHKLEWLIAWRYLGAQRKSLFVSLIGIFSMLGVSIGVFALVVALAAVNGFEEEVTAQMIGKDAHFEVMAYNGEMIAPYDSLTKEVRARDSRVVASSPFIIYKVGISSKKVNDGIVIYGIDPATAKEVTDIHKYIKWGEYSVDSLEDLTGKVRPGIILGSGLANRLRVVVGDKLVLQLFQSPDEALGSMKATTAAFYRVTGASTQLRGVVPDIILPSVYAPSPAGARISFAAKLTRLAAKSYPFGGKSMA